MSHHYYRSARETTYKGVVFDSKQEAQRFVELDAREKAGEIWNLERQPEFTLHESFRVNDPTTKRGYRTIRKTIYTADFIYHTKEYGREMQVIEEVKGYKTKDYLLRKKFFLEKYVKDDEDVLFLEIMS